MKQRTANNNFIPSTINFHNQISDTTLDAELIAVESHTWQGCIKPGCKVREKFSLHIHLSILAFFGRKFFWKRHGQIHAMLQKVPGLTVQRAAGSDTGAMANERVTPERNALAERNTELLKSRRDVVTFCRR